jgi:hypothetical protein
VDFVAQRGRAGRAACALCETDADAGAVQKVTAASASSTSALPPPTRSAAPQPPPRAPAIRRANSSSSASASPSCCSTTRSLAHSLATCKSQATRRPCGGGEACWSVRRALVGHRDEASFSRQSQATYRHEEGSTPQRKPANFCAAEPSRPNSAESGAVVSLRFINSLDRSFTPTQAVGTVSAMIDSPATLPTLPAHPCATSSVAISCWNQPPNGQRPAHSPLPVHCSRSHKSPHPLSRRTRRPWSVPSLAPLVQEFP